MNKNQPPNWINRILNWYCHEAYANEIRGDLMELYERWLEKGKFVANLKYVLNAMLFMRMYNAKINSGHQKTQIDMFKNHFKIAIRSAIKQKRYTAVNLFGLATGIACFTIIMLYLQGELSYDKFHKDSDRIYRVVKDGVDTGISDAHVPPALAPAMLRELPEVEQSVRFHTPWSKGLLSYEDKAFNGLSYLYVDSTFFDVFSFPLISGTGHYAFTNPSSIVLSEGLARNFFNDDDAIGKSLVFNFGGRENKVLKVSAVVKEIPSQSHFSFDFLVNDPSVFNDNWWGETVRPYHTYIKLRPNSPVIEVEKKIQSLAEAHATENLYQYSTQPLVGMEGIHLASHRTGELQVNGNKLYIKVLSIIALFVILIAGVNYVNLTTARSSIRAKEIGVRKAVGALRRSLVNQFITESVVMSISAGLISLVLIEATLPFFNNIMRKELILFNASSQPIWWLMITVVLVIGIIAGLYPAFYLSGFKPITAFKNLSVSGSGFSLRRGLVVFQFFLAALLMIGVLVVQKQLDYIHAANLGFDKDQVVVFPDFWQVPNRDRGGTLRNAISELSEVQHVGAGSELGAITDAGGMPITSADSKSEVNITMLQVDFNYLDLFGIEMKEGRNFSPEFPADSIEDSRIILNETAVKQLGLTSPVVGQTVKVWGDESTIIGVVNDFHFTSLHNDIKPIGFWWDDKANMLAVKLSGGDISEKLAQIEKIWTEYAPGIPFNFYFLDDAIEQQYRAEENFRIIFSAMTGLSLVIACLGLVGLAAFMAQQRTKEIGIRKVLGASIKNIVTLLSKEFVKLVLIANIIAWPIAWIAMRIWLENFAYRIKIDLLIFIITGIMALVIAMLIVGWQTMKVATSNPIDSLKDE